MTLALKLHPSIFDEPEEPDTQIIENAHHLSAYNKIAVRNAQECGCYFCLRTFPASEIKKWIDSAMTALCPHCGIDAVLPGVTDEKTLAAAFERWFCSKPKSVNPEEPA